MEDNVTRRDLIVEKGLNEQVQDAIKALTQEELLYQFTIQDDDGPEELCDQIRYFATVCGVNYIFFEPIQDIVVGPSDSKEATLSDLAIRLSNIAAELNIAIVSIAHTNDNGDIKYCRMLGQRAGFVIRLEREMDSPDEEVANTTYVYVEKNRPLSDLGFAGSLYFDSDTFTITEKEF
jgi:hypothetical protein